MRGFNIAEQGHIVQVIAPKDGNAGAPVTAIDFDMSNWKHASIIVGFGVTGGTPTSIILKAATSNGGVGTAIGFSYYPMTTAGGDAVGTRTTVASTGITSISPNDGIFYVIELDAEQLGSGNSWLQVEVTIPASSNLVTCFAILSGGRHMFAGTPSIT